MSKTKLCMMCKKQVENLVQVTLENHEDKRLASPQDQIIHICSNCARGK